MKPGEVKECRRRLDLNQVELACLVGVSSSSVMGWEKGRSSPSAWHAGILSALASSPNRASVKRLIYGAGVIKALAWGLAPLN